MTVVVIMLFLEIQAYYATERSAVQRGAPIGVQGRRSSVSKQLVNNSYAARSETIVALLNCVTGGYVKTCTIIPLIPLWKDTRLYLCSPVTTGGYVKTCTFIPLIPLWKDVVNNSSAARSDSIVALLNCDNGRLREDVYDHPINSTLERRGSVSKQLVNNSSTARSDSIVALPNCDNGRQREDVHDHALPLNLPNLMIYQSLSLSDMARKSYS
ncbi:hypothetical protein J6590_041810 [Homalodisca vitripennis]|nr:hypothetical protein J6590_041810 [Homalodisca vitripennis]